MAFLAGLPAILGAVSAGGTVISAVSAKRQGDNVAAQELAQGNAAKASAQRAAYNEGRQTALVQSRAKAYAAAAGGSSDDPSVVTNLAQIGSEGEYRRLTALYGGDTAAEGADMEADASRNKGRARAISTVLTGATSLASKYWGGSAPPDAAPG